MTCVYKSGSQSPCLIIKANKPIKKTSFWSIKPRYEIVCVYILYIIQSIPSLAFGMIMQCNKDAQQNACFVCLCAP